MADLIAYTYSAAVMAGGVMGYVKKGRVTQNQQLFSQYFNATNLTIIQVKVYTLQKM